MNHILTNEKTDLTTLCIYTDFCCLPAIFCSNYIKRKNDLAHTSVGRRTV